MDDLFLLKILRSCPKALHNILPIYWLSMSFTVVNALQSILQPFAKTTKHWNNRSEIKAVSPLLLSSTDVFVGTFLAFWLRFKLCSKTSFPAIFDIKTYRQGTYCKNLAIRVTPFLIVSEWSVGQTISKTVLPHFSKGTIAYIPMTL